MCFFRNEVQQLQDKVKHQQQPSPVLTVSSSSNIDNDQLKKLESDISSRISDVVNRVSEIDKNNKIVVDELDNKIQTIIKSQEAAEISHKQESEEIQQKLQRLSTTKPDTIVSSAPVLSPPVSHPSEHSQESVDELKLFVLQTVEATKDLVRAPLSVVFDAVRSEDFIGEDNTLTFSKVGIAV